MCKLLFVLTMLLPALALEARADTASGQPAEEDPAADRGPLQLEALGGWGFSPGYHAEAGTRFGYFFTDEIFGGVAYSYFFGGGSRTTNRRLASAEGGYRFLLPGQFELLPYFGIGAVMIGRSSGNDVSRLLIDPGMKIDYPVGPVRVGLDNQFAIEPHRRAYALAGTVGVRF